MKTTPNLAIPYAEASDPPDLEYLDGTTQAWLDTYLTIMTKDWGYADIPTRAGFAWQSGTAMRARRIGKKVDAVWGISNAGLVADSVERTVADVPASWRPTQTVYFTWTSSVAERNARGIVYPDGRVTISCSTGTALGAYYLLPAGCGWLVD